MPLYLIDQQMISLLSLCISSQQQSLGSMAALDLSTLWQTRLTQTVLTGNWQNTCSRDMSHNDMLAIWASYCSAGISATFYEMKAF